MYLDKQANEKYETNVLHVRLSSGQREDSFHDVVSIDPPVLSNLGASSSIESDRLAGFQN